VESSSEEINPQKFLSFRKAMIIMNAIFQMLNPSNTLTVNRLLAHAIGLSEAVVYAALISKCSYYERNGILDDSGWFYSTVPDLEASIALSEYQQKRCIKNLVDVGLIESKNRGLPAKRCFRIIEDIELISSLISQGEKKQLSIKPAAVQSYEKKRKNKIDAQPPCSVETTEQEKNTTSNDFGACSEETAEQPDEELPSLLPRNCGASSEKSVLPSLYKSKDNKSKEKNPLSINPNDGADLMDRIDSSIPNTVSPDERTDYTDIIRENIGYDFLLESSPSQKGRINEIVGIMLDVVCSTKKYIRVNGEDFPQSVVKSQFLKLDSTHIEYVITALDKNTSDVRNIRAYLITALYNAPLTIDSFYSAMVNHDMYGSK
jgi:hypothetical protein